MRKHVYGLLGLAMALASSAHAQAVGACETGVAQQFLENSELKASLFNTGGLFFGGTTTSGDGYHIPKSQTVQTRFGERPVSPVFAAGLWVAGTVDGDERVAAARYGGYDFWPGPLEDAAHPPQDCSEYDRIYVVSRRDIARYLGSGEPSDDLRDWPYHLGAPVIDGDGIEGNYNLAGGDQPDLIGDVAAWWVMNDAGNDHNPGAPIGVEVQAHAFLYDSFEAAISPVFSQTTFIRYAFVNRREVPITDVYVALFADPDLGDAGDDYIGADTLRNMGIVYNDSNEDSRYGTAPPAFGFQLLKGPVVGNDTLGMTSTSTYIGGGPDGTQDPGTPEEYRFYMQGLWGNGTPYYELSNGFEQHGAPTTTFMYAGDPVTESYYSELNTDGNGANSPTGDRRITISTGPFVLEPGEPQTLLFAFPYGRGESNIHSVAVLQGRAAALQRVAAAGGFETGRPVSGSESLPAIELTLTGVRPNPFSRDAEVRLTLPDDTHTRATVIDALGRQLDVLVDGVLPRGETVLQMPTDLAPGTYVLRVQVAPGAEEWLPFTVVR